MRLEDLLRLTMSNSGIFSIRTNDIRWFVINYGPPASGKTNVKTTQEIVNLIDSNFSDIDVDTIVSDIYFYRGGTDIADLDQRTYWQLRSDADEQSNKMLVNAIIFRNNIIWETTGRDRSYIKYVIDFVKQYGYHVLLTIPYLFLENEIIRCKSRKQPADCSLEYISDIRLKSYNNFEHVAKDCDRVMVFDNNSKLFVIYDSTKPGCGNLNSVLSDLNQSGLHTFILKKCIPKKTRARKYKQTN